jgi:hypothetical protein
MREIGQASPVQSTAVGSYLCFGQRFARLLNFYAIWLLRYMTTKHRGYITSNHFPAAPRYINNEANERHGFGRKQVWKPFQMALPLIHLQALPQSEV